MVTFSYTGRVYLYLKLRFSNAESSFPSIAAWNCGCQYIKIRQTILTQKMYVIKITNSYSSYIYPVCGIIKIFLEFTDKNLFIFLRFYIFIFREKGREGERERGKHHCVVACCVSLAGVLPDLQPRHVHWLGIKLQLCDSQTHTQSIELHQPEHW